MLRSVLSVLLMGMVPLFSGGATTQIGLQSLPISAPSSVTAALQNGLAKKTLSASGIVIMDLGSGQQLYSKGGQTPRPLASLTKLMTALIIVETHPLDEWVKVPKDVEGVEDAKFVKTGEEYRVGDLLTALLVNSANDAAVALAVHHSGSVHAFATEMNIRAHLLGLTHTSFRNPIGFDDPDQYSSPQDIAWLATFVLRNPEIRKRMSMASATIASKDGRELALTQTHALLSGSGLSPVIAGKTGTTDEAGQCLLSIVKEGEREYVVVLLGSQDRYKDMRAVLSVLASV